MSKKYDFGGWATRNNLKCSDGKTIMKDAFKDNDGKIVPLVWNHQHNDPYNVLGHALLENRESGVYAYCNFNDTESGKAAKTLVEHGDITALSIYANQLRQRSGDVLHGDIKEVSLVLAGANPGAFIESVLRHGEASEEEGVIYTGEPIEVKFGDEPAEETVIEHADDKKEEEEDNKMAEEVKKPESEETIADVFNTLSEKQKTVVYAMIGAALEENEEDKEEVKHNAFDQNTAHEDENVLSHSDTEAIFNDVRRYGSLKDSVLAHGIDNIDFLFPDEKNLNTPPAFISRDTGWVSKVMGAVHHTPFSRIKSIFANITEDDARAKGYIKGNQKTGEIFPLLKRSTTPTTVIKLQSFDRDDITDITDFDVVAWIKSEMRTMLNEELARAFLIGDGRSAASNDKINELNIRPIFNDDDLYTIKSLVVVASNATNDQRAKAFIKAAIRSRKNYKGSGEPTLFTTEDMLTDCLLLEDTTGRIIYDSVQKLANMLRVKEIVTVPVMENQTGARGGNLLGIIVNLTDYNVGADKGGAVSLFDDFDIDYNKQKYLIETRCSGALIKPFSAIALEESTTGVGAYYYVVTPSSGDVPEDEGWYEKILGSFVATSDPTVIPRKTYYADAGESFSEATMTGITNPKSSGLYELNGVVYSLTNDTSVVEDKTYYSKS